MRLWVIREIANGFVLQLPNGQEDFVETWKDVIDRLKVVDPFE